MKFAQKTSRQDVVDAYGFDWYKIVKVDGGYMHPAEAVPGRVKVP